MNRKRYMLPLYVLGMLITARVSADIEIDSRIQLSYPISPDGKKLAVLIGPRKHTFSNTESCVVWLVDLDSLQVDKLPNSEGASALGLSWRKQDERNELYIMQIDFKKTTVHSVLGLSEEGEVVYSQEEAQGVISRSIRWSPNGKSLAGCCVKEPGEPLTEAVLGVSYDGGKTANIFKGVPCDPFLFPVWASNKEIFVSNSYYMLENTEELSFEKYGCITKVTLQGDKHVDTETFIKGKSIRLLGSIDNKCVYRDKENLFCDSQKLYSGSRFGAIVDKDRIAIECSSENEIRVVGPNGALVCKRTLNEEQHLYALSAKIGKVFILDGGTRILEWDMKSGAERLIFRVLQ